MLEPDLILGLEQHDALDHVLELAHVAGPCVLEHRLEGLRVKARSGPAELAAEAADEVLRQERDVLPPLAQGGHRDRNDVQPVIKVFAELPLRDRARQVAMRGRHNAHVDRDVGLSPDPAEGPALEHAQELGLELQRHLPDLVQEQRAGVREIEQALLEVLGVGESTLLVAEELALQQVLGDGAAVEVDEGT